MEGWKHEKDGRKDGRMDGRTEGRKGGREGRREEEPSSFAAMATPLFGRNTTTFERRKVRREKRNERERNGG
jgi:hypothetical protein